MTDNCRRSRHRKLIRFSARGSVPHIAIRFGGMRPRAARGGNALKSAAEFERFSVPRQSRIRSRGPYRPTRAAGWPSRQPRSRGIARDDPKRALNFWRQERACRVSFVLRHVRAISAPCPGPTARRDRGLRHLNGARRGGKQRDQRRLGDRSMFYRAKTAAVAALVTACVGKMLPSAAFARGGGGGGGGGGGRGGGFGGGGFEWRRIRWRHGRLPLGRFYRWRGRLLPRILRRL